MIKGLECVLKSQTINRKTQKVLSILNYFSMGNLPVDLSF